MVEEMGQSNGSGGSVRFLVVHSEEKSEWSNPHSALLIEGLWLYQCDALVVGTPEEYEPSSNGVMVVPLFDLQFGLNRFSPVRKEASGVPTWAKVLSTNFCIAVHKRCVDFPVALDVSARQIAKMFAKSVDSIVGSVPKERQGRDKVRRRAWRAPVSQWTPFFWRR